MCEEQKRCMAVSAKCRPAQTTCMMKCAYLWERARLCEIQVSRSRETRNDIIPQNSMLAISRAFWPIVSAWGHIFTGYLLSISVEQGSFSFLVSKGSQCLNVMFEVSQSNPYYLYYCTFLSFSFKCCPSFSISSFPYSFPLWCKAVLLDKVDNG